jgi:hypothetical protein
MKQTTSSDVACEVVTTGSMGLKRKQGDCHQLGLINQDEKVWEYDRAEQIY